MSIKVTACLNPFSNEKTEYTFDSGISVNEIIRKIDTLHAVNTGWRVLFDDEIVTDFERKPEENQHVYIKLVPEGDNKNLGTGMKVGGGALVGIGILVSVLTGWTGIGLGVGVALIGAGVGMGAGGVVLYNIEIPSLSSSSNKKRESPEQDPSIRGSQNQTRPYGILPVLFGRRRIYADLATTSYTWVDPADGAVYLYQLFCAGQKDMEIDRNSIKIDETLLKDFSASGNIDTILNGQDALINMRIAHGESFPPFAEKCVHEIQHNSVLKNMTDDGIDGSIIETTPDGTTEINVDIFFYNGLAKYNDDGSLEETSVEVMAWYKKADEDDSAYRTLGYFSGDTNELRGNKLKTKRFAISKTDLEPAIYTVKISRITADSSDIKIVDEVYVGSIRAIKDEYPVRQEMCERLTLIGLRIKASEKLQNVVQKLNFIAESRLPVYDGQSWNYSRTSNPASAAMYAMNGDFAQQKLASSEIDSNSFGKLYEWCRTHSYECNQYLTESMTISQLLTSIASTCRAEILRVNGKLTVIQDIERESFVQLFTPRNSANYKESIMLADVPDEIKLGFVDSENGFAENEVSVYNTPDGNKSGMTKTSQEISLWGVTNSVQARKLGMYNYAVSKHRPIIHSFDADFEYLMCRKGDWIKYAGDIALAGITQGRIVARILDGAGFVTGFEFDEEIPMEDGKSYAIRVRLNNGETVLLDVENNGETSNSVSITSFISTETAPKEGDLFAFGERGNEAIDLIITDIQCGENLSANLTCVEYSPEIFGVDEEGFELPDFENKLSMTQGATDSGKVSGWRTWTTFNDSEEMPEKPSGDGTNDGWHYVQTAESKWISTKTAETVNDGEWSYPSPMGQYAVEKIKDIVGNDKIEVGSPDKPVISSAEAGRDGITIRCLPFGVGLANTIKVIDFYIKKSPSAGWEFFAESSSLSATYVFDRDNDGYPEKNDMSRWLIRAKAFNIYNKEGDFSAEVLVNTERYGTWSLQPPLVYTRINDRTITLKLSQPSRADSLELYGTLKYRIQVRRPEIDGENTWLKPATSLNPEPVKDSDGNIVSGNEENYKDGSGYIISDETYIQKMPLDGQSTNNIRDTLYQFRIIAENEAGTSLETVINATALCTNIKDIVAANEDYKQLYITDLSALSANIGAILEGAFGDGANLWDLSTFVDKYGNQHYKGRMYVGGTEQYLHVDPIIRDGIPTGEYSIAFKVGSFEITSEASKINGEFIVQLNETSLDRTRITPQGTYYEHRSTSDGEWITVAKQETKGLLSQILYSEQSIVVTNATIAERRKLGHDIGKPHLTNSALVYHFDTDLFNQHGNKGYTLDYKSYPVLVDAGDNNPSDVIDFTPAILTLSPYSEIGKSLYGQYNLSHPISGNSWTVDFWIQYIWAENQTVFDIGSETDRISVVISTGEPNYNEYDEDSEPPYNYEVTETESLVYNVTLGADNFIFHTGDRDEHVLFSDFGIKFESNTWLHFAVVMSADKISLFIGKKKVDFSRYSASQTSGIAVFNKEMNSFCLDELYIDTVAEDFEMFVTSSLNKIPWGTLDYTKKHFIIDAADLRDFHTNLFDSDIFKQKVLEIISEYHS